MSFYNETERDPYPIDSQYVKTEGDTTIIRGSLKIDAPHDDTLSDVLVYDVATKEVKYKAEAPLNPFNQSLNTTDSVEFQKMTYPLLTQQGGEVPNPQILVRDLTTQEVKYREFSSLPVVNLFDQNLNTTDDVSFNSVDTNTVITDTITEKTLDNGVSVDSLVIKDGGVVSVEGQSNIHAMNQPLRTTDSPTFGNLTLNGVGSTAVITTPYLITTAFNGGVNFTLTAPPAPSAYRQFIYDANAPNGCSGFTVRNISNSNSSHACLNVASFNAISNAFIAMQSPANFTWMAGMRGISDQYVIGRKPGISDELENPATDKLRLSSTGILQVDTINEIVLDAGVTIEGLVIKDSGITMTPPVGSNEDVLTITPGGLIQKQDQQTITKKITLSAFNGESISTVDIVTVSVPVILQNIATAGNLQYVLGSDFSEVGGIITYNGTKSVLCQLVFTSSIAGNKDRVAKMSVFKNGAQLVCSLKTISTLTYYDSISATIITTLNTNDTLSLRLQNDTDNTDFTIRCTTLSLLGLI